MASPKKHPFKVDEGHVITPAFKLGGTQYYKVLDVFNTFAFRAFSALDVYDRWNNRCSPDYLRGLGNALLEIVNNNKNGIKISEVSSLATNLLERVDFAIPSADLVWEMAAVAFFDESESPYQYDPEYGKKKIAFWQEEIKKSKEPNFFFRMLTKDILPSPKLSGIDSETYSKVANKISVKHYEKIIGLLPQQTQNKGFYQALLYQKSLQQTSAV